VHKYMHACMHRYTCTYIYVVWTAGEETRHLLYHIPYKCTHSASYTIYHKSYECVHNIIYHMSVYIMPNIMYHITYAIHHTGAYRTGSNSWSTGLQAV
jgi:hypothetical protein